MGEGLTELMHVSWLDGWMYYDPLISATIKSYLFQDLICFTCAKIIFSVWV